MTENQPGSPFPFHASSRHESSDNTMGDDQSSTPLPSSFTPLSGPLTISSGPA